MLWMIQTVVCSPELDEKLWEIVVEERGENRMIEPSLSCRPVLYSS